MPVMLCFYSCWGHLTVSIVGDVTVCFPPFRRNCLLLFVLDRYKSNFCRLASGLEWIIQHNKYKPLDQRLTVLAIFLHSWVLIVTNTSHDSLLTRHLNECWFTSFIVTLVRYVFIFCETEPKTEC